MSGKKKLISLVIVILIIVLFAYTTWILLYVNTARYQPNPHNPGLECGTFIKNESNNTIILAKLDCPSNDLKWSDVTVTTGFAILPSGIMKEGDVITNCGGRVTLVWRPTNSVIGTWDFEE